ncbi:MAG: amidohydrolase [Bacteroidetes bacterium]|nr:amidohydrolase [Bacteroidota bacterium]MBS1973471.1 amidohydrolase [Bacteroidota bacterium]
MYKAFNRILIIALCLVAISSTYAQKKKNTPGEDEKLKKQAVGDLQLKFGDYKKMALDIWSYAEVGYKEYKSSALLQQTLKDDGFSIEAGVAEMPTAFVATYGSGKPVIGILAEFDALPGLSQDSVPEKKPIPGMKSGHGCGHHLFGVASMAAGIELKKLIESGKLKGTIKVFGCPAEEGGSGKVYMVRAGLFSNVDIVMHWHPGSENKVELRRSMANISAKFRFHGLAAHAAAAPDKGRSALDAVEGMDMMVNMMREHVPSSTRIHYVITDGGKAPNVVPDFAESYYYVRNQDRSIVQDVFERVVKAAEGAALGTGTTMDYEITGGVYDLLPNKTLAEAMQKNLLMIGGVAYTDENVEFAKKIQATFSYKAPGIETAKIVQPLSEEKDDGGGSTDVADVSWAVPTVGLNAATWVPGTPAHSWQATACGGTSIGIKGMMVAAKTIALTGIDLFSDSTLIQKAKEEFNKAKGPDFHYKALLGERKPALHYRD